MASRDKALGGTTQAPEAKQEDGNLGDRRNERSEKRRAANAMQIEKAALLLFLERGVEAVTVDDIAEAAGVSRRTFYRYFNSPSDLLTAAPQRSMRRTVRDFQSRPIDEPIIQSFLAALRMAKFTAEEQELSQISFGVMRRSPEAWNRSMMSMQPDVVDVYGDMIAERLRTQNQDPAQAAFIAAPIAALIWQVCLESERLRNPMSVDQLEAAIRVFGQHVQEMPEADRAPKANKPKA